MLNRILRHDGSYTIENYVTRVTLTNGTNQYGMPFDRLGKRHHFTSEKDWLLTNGTGSLSMCGIPVNSVVIDRLMELSGDIRFVFNFADRDCPEYSDYMRKKDWADKQTAYHAQLDKINDLRKSSSKTEPSAVDDPVPAEEYDKLNKLNKAIYTYDEGDWYRPDMCAKRSVNNAGYYVSEDNQLFFKLDSLDDTISALIMYAFYKSLLWLPYGEAATDDLPTLEEVLLNGEPTTLFDEILHYISDNMFDGIPKDNGGKYYIMLRNKNPIYKVRGGIIPSPKMLDDKYKMLYIGIGRVGNPLYVRMSRKEYKHAYRVRSIESVLNFYKKDEFRTAIHDGKDIQECGNEYLQSGTSDIMDILLFAVAFPYLVSIVAGKSLQHERDVVIGYETTFHIRQNGGLDPQRISVQYITIESLNQIWDQLTNNTRHQYKWS